MKTWKWEKFGVDYEVVNSPKGYGVRVERPLGTPRKFRAVAYAPTGWTDNEPHVSADGKRRKTLRQAKADCGVIVKALTALQEELR